MRRCLLCGKNCVPGNGPFFRVPKDEERRSKWREICKMDFTSASNICIDHFSPTEIVISGKNSYLLPKAVPRIKLPITPFASTCEHRCALCQKRCHPDNGYFFKVPQEESKRNLWSKICSMTFLPDSMICSDHFLENSFIRYKHRVTLMPDALPIRPRLTKRQIEVNIGAEERVIDDDNRSEISVNIPMTSSCLLLDDPLSLNKSTFVEPHPVINHCVDKEVQTDPSMLGYEKYIYKCRQLETQIKELKLQLMRSSMAMNSLYKIFTEGQIRKLTSPADIHWREHDMENAWQLYKKGSGAYKYLYEKGFPLPHISSIQRWQRKHKKDENDNSSDVPSNENNEEVIEEEDEVNDFSGDDNDWFDDFYEEEAANNNDKISEENNISTIKTEAELIQDPSPQIKAVKVADKNKDVRNKVKPETIAAINVPSQYASPELNAIIASSNTKFFIAKKPTEVEISKEQNPTFNIKDESKPPPTVKAAIRPRSQCDMPGLNNTTPVKKVKAEQSHEEVSG